MRHIGEEEDPRAAWTMLAKAKEARTGMALVSKLTELMTLEQSEETSMATHGARVKELARELNELLSKDVTKLATALPTAALIKSLHPKYEAFAVNVLQADADKLEFDDVVRRAIHEEQRQKNRTTSAAHGELIAAANFARANPKAGKKIKKCGYCGKRGHTEDDCWTKERDETAVKASDKKHSANLAVTHHATMALAAEARLPSSQWLIDSAATIHMCHDRSLFSNIRSIPTSTIVFGAGQTAKATEAGDIKVRVALSEGAFNVTLTDVLYAPAMKRNLISMMQWARQGITCSTVRNGTCVIRRNGVTLGQVSGHNNLLPVNITPSPVSGSHSANVAHSVYSNKATLWHYRLGHVNAADMQRLPSMADGLDYAGTILGACGSCMKGKLHALPHPRSATHRATVPLELVHTDLCGPLPLSRDGFQYFITFIDDCTRFTEVRLLRNKREAMRAFIEYQAWIEKATGRSIQMLRSDNGGEYTSKVFNEWLSDDGVRRQLSAPYTQQQNGVSERYNRTLVECARTLIIAAGLDKGYWSDAVLTATHLRNRLPTTALDNKTPFQAFYGHKPSLSHLRVFGCRAYALIDKSKRGKLDAKARPCINLGPAQGYKAYRLMDTTTNETFVSRNVRFIENRFMNDSAGQVGDAAADIELLTMSDHSVTNESSNESKAASEA
jgi:hypothetical protein